MSEPLSANDRRLHKAVFQHRIASVRALETLNARAGLPIEFQTLKGQRPAIDLEGGQGQSLCLWITRSTSGFQTTPVVEADIFTIRFITAGRMTRQYRRHDDVVDTGFATISAFDDLRGAGASEQFCAMSAMITRATLLQRHRLLEGVPDAQIPEFEPIARIDGVAMRSLFQSVCHLQERLKLIDVEDDLFFPLFEEIVAYQVLSGWPRRKTPSRARPAEDHPKPVRRAIDYIDAHLGEPIRLADVAAAAGVSVRVLQLAFKRELGLTPFGFMLEQRLTRVRDELRLDGNRASSFSQLARRWGFVHMSDFTLRYRKAFGCTPGETRRSAR